MITRIYPHKITQLNYIASPVKFNQAENQEKLNDRIVLELPRYYYGVAFTGVGIQDKLASLEHVNCPICGHEMIPEDRYNQLLEKSKNLSNVYSVLQILRENKQFIKPPFDRLMQKTEEVANKDPMRRMHDYAQSIKKDAKKYLGEQIENQNKKIEKESLSLQDRELFEEFKFSTSILLKGSKTEDDLIKEFSQLINNCFKLMNNTKSMKFCFEYRKLLSLYSKYTHSVRHNPYTNVGLDVVKNVFGASKTNSYILWPEDENGASTILTCTDCTNNTKRINRGLFITPEINVNYRKYLDSISKSITKTEDESLFSYPKKIIKIVSKTSKGLMKADKMAISRDLRQKNFDVSRFEFDLVKIEDVPCPICGTTMLTHNKRAAFNEKLIQKMSVQELYNFVNENYKYVHTRYKFFIDEFLKIVEENPNYDCNKVYKVLGETYNREILKINKKSFSKIKNIAETYKMSPNDWTLINSYLNRMEQILKNNKILTVQEYSDLMRESLLLIKDKTVWGLAAKAAGSKRIWDLYNGASAFYMPDFITDKFPSKLNASIDSIYRDAIITGDHLVARSKNGTNKKGNLLPMCKRCNHAKQDKSFDVLISRNPKAIEYIPNTLRYIDAKIKSGEVKYDESYISEVLETLNSLAEQYSLTDIHFSL